MADRISDRHKGQRIYETGADKRKRAKQQKDKDALLLAKTRRMTDFISVSEASQVLPAVSVPNEPVIDDEFDWDFDNSQSELSQLQSEPVHSEGEESVQNRNNCRNNICTSKIHPHTTSLIHVLLCHVNDIGMWPPLVDKEITEYWIRNGIEQLQNCDEVLFEQCSAVQTETTGEKKSYRKCSLNMFERRNRNGEIVKRSWLCFSPAHGKLYCLPCRLMSSFPNQLTRDGYCDWRHASTRLAEHERSKDHIEAVIGLARRAKEVGVIDCKLTRQLVEVENYWKDVLQRVITVITFVCERGLALRGENETIGSPRNGNYLGILEPIAEYDEFLKQHMQKHANRGSGHVNYLSSTICEEFVEVMGRRVLLEITSRIKKSRYYSISLDSTPDEGHIDQLTLVFRYMEKTNPVERFVKFMPNQGHKAQEMFDGLVKFLNEHAIDMSLCRGQSFDNASAMSGRYNGLQAKVTSQNSLAAWIPCAGHSLNLVARAAAECSSAAVEYFNVLEDIYVFFTASTHRYEVLKRFSPVVPKRINTTRWSCRADATKSLSLGYAEFIEALDHIAADSDELADVRCKAVGLSNRLCQLEMGIYTVFWHDILERVNATSKILQDPHMDLNSAVAALQSLKTFVESKRECFKEYEDEGMVKSGQTEYVNKRERRRNVRLDPPDHPQLSQPQVIRSKSDIFRIENFLPVIDQFSMNLEQRLCAYELLSCRFYFLRKLDVLSADEILAAASNLVEAYKDDLDSCLGNELVQFAAFVDVFKDEQHALSADVSHEQFMYQLILQKRVEGSFPNVEIALRIYLVLMVSNCSAERSFSKMKLIKNRLRTSMSNDRLSHLALMSIESDILREINFQDLLTEFAKKKARKVSLI